jgi:hypothetical protein
MPDDSLRNPETVKELTVHDRDGVWIGVVEQVYVDDTTRHPEWVTVRMGPHGVGETFLPLEDAVRGDGHTLRVAHTVDTVRKAPLMNADQHLSLEQEQELYVHYGLTPPDDEASGAPGVGDDRPRAPLTGHDQGMESFAELAAEPPAERPRLRKFVPPEEGQSAAE